MASLAAAPDGAPQQPRFPARAFIQGTGDAVPKDNRLVQEELESRGIPVVILHTESAEEVPFPEDLSKMDLVVGDFQWTRCALRQLGVSMPTPRDYPECLQHLLHRRMWTSTLGEARARLAGDPTARFFMKPALETKAFSGGVATLDEIDLYLNGIPGIPDIRTYPPSLAVHCSELVTLISEHRVYVVNGRIRAICQYIGPEDAALDRDVVEEAVRTFSASDEGRELVGYGLDVAVMQIEDGAPPVTGLIEVNDGFSLGHYDGVSARDYTDMFIARWERLVSGV